MVTRILNVGDTFKMFDFIQTVIKVYENGSLHCVNQFGEHSTFGPDYLNFWFLED